MRNQRGKEKGGRGGEVRLGDKREGRKGDLCTRVTGVSASSGVLNQKRVGSGLPRASQRSLAVSPAMTSVTGSGWCRKNGLRGASARAEEGERGGGRESSMGMCYGATEG